MTNTKTDGERLVKLEVKVENIEKLVTGMDGKLDDIIKEQNDARMNNVTRGELDAELKRIGQTMASIKKRNGYQIAVTAVLSVVLTTCVTLLLTYFIQTIGR